MSENKRFCMVVEDSEGNFHYLDNLTKKRIKSTLKLENMLNDLWKQTQRFEKHNQRLIEENEQLKQFKEDVFFKIDMHLRMLPIARDNVFNKYDSDSSLYTGAIYMLETLKKELEE